MDANRENSDTHTDTDKDTHTDTDTHTHVVSGPAVTMLPPVPCLSEDPHTTPELESGSAESGAVPVCCCRYGICRTGALLVCGTHTQTYTDRHIDIHRQTHRHTHTNHTYQNTHTYNFI